MYFLIAFFLACAQLFADEYHSLITFEGVNAITGAYTAEESDLFIQGAEPLHIKRIYNSHHLDNTYSGWQFFPHLKLTFQDKVTEHSRSRDYYLHVAEPTGAELIYTRQKTEGNTIIYQIDLENHGKTLTNCPPGNATARTHLKNNVAYRYDESHIHIHCANGAERSYVRLQSRSSSFFLEWERLQSGNHITYEYDNEQRLKLVCTQNPSRTRIYASATFTYKEEQITLEASDGRTIVYELEKDRSKYFLLKEALTSSRPEEKMHYHPSHSKYRASPIAKRLFPKGKFREIFYYTKNDVSRHNPKLHRVKEVHTSSGPNGSDVRSYQFAYAVDEHKGIYTDHRRTDTKKIPLEKSPFTPMCQIQT